MTGDLILNGVPTADNQAATKAYVDNKNIEKLVYQTYVAIPRNGDSPVYVDIPTSVLTLSMTAFILETNHTRGNVSLKGVAGIGLGSQIGLDRHFSRFIFPVINICAANVAVSDIYLGSVKIVFGNPTPSVIDIPVWNKESFRFEFYTNSTLSGTLNCNFYLM